MDVKTIRIANKFALAYKASFGVALPIQTFESRERVEELVHEALKSQAPALKESAAELAIAYGVKMRKLPIAEQKTSAASLPSKDVARSAEPDPLEPLSDQPPQMEESMDFSCFETIPWQDKDWPLVREIAFKHAGHISSLWVSQAEQSNPANLAEALSAIAEAAGPFANSIAIDVCSALARN